MSGQHFPKVKGIEGIPMLMKIKEIDEGSLRCPCKRRETVSVNGNYATCNGPNCEYGKGFLQHRGQPVFINFENQLGIFERGDFAELSDVQADTDRTGVIDRKSGLNLAAFLNSPEPTATNVLNFVNALPSSPRILVVGGGARGNATQELWDNVGVKIVSIDVYASENTSFIADAHYLPFATESFDGVLIQAVLEHVVDPVTVVSEIFRVLKWEGGVYCEIPFMQQVHEGAFDFTRYTLSGHRWLYRHFQELSSGTTKGPATVLAWSIRYAAEPLLGKVFARLLFGISMSVMVFLDKIYTGKRSVDGASGTFFWGKKKRNFVFGVNELRSFYSGVQR
jgi:SAM-dependent methyltransferase